MIENLNLIELLELLDKVKSDPIHCRQFHIASESVSRDEIVEIIKYFGERELYTPIFYVLWGFRSVAPLSTALESYVLHLIKEDIQANGVEDVLNRLIRHIADAEM